MKLCYKFFVLPIQDYSLPFTKSKTSFMQYINKLILFTAGLVTCLGLSDGPFIKKSHVTEIEASESMLFHHYVWKFSLVKPNVSSDIKFQDENVLIEFEPAVQFGRLSGPEAMGFWITNLSGQTIQLDWSQSYVESLKGKSRKVWQANKMDHINWNGSPSNLYIKTGAKTGDGFVPLDCVRWRKHDGYWDDQGKWRQPWTEITDWQLFNEDDFNILCSNHEQVKAEVVGKTFGMRMAFIIGGQAKFYDFTFKVEDIEKRKNTSNITWKTCLGL